MSKSVYRFASTVVATILLLALNLLAPGCATNGQSSFTPRVDKNGPPYTKYPHLGRNHFNRMPQKSSGGR